MKLMTDSDKTAGDLKKARRVLAARSFRLQRRIAKARLEQRDTLAALAAVDEALGTFDAEAVPTVGAAAVQPLAVASQAAAAERTNAVIKAAAAEIGFPDAVQRATAGIAAGCRSAAE